MAEAATHGNWLPLTFYMEKHVVNGTVHHPANLRLTDFLNQADDRNNNGLNNFIEVKDTNMVHEDGIEDNQPVSYVNREAILLVVTEDGDAARGIGASASPKPYPFVLKSPVPITAETSAYTLSGYMYCSAGQVVGDVLRSPVKFLPLTDVQIRPHGQTTWRTAPFAALNRSQILSLAQEKSYG